MESKNAKSTIKDVARLAGVSVTSVSNFFNGRGHRMSADTQSRIRRTVDALDYRPSGAARQLRTGASPMLGLLVPTVANAFFGELAVAMEHAAREKGFRIILCNTLQSASAEREFWLDLSSLGVKGVICSSAVVTNSQLEEYCALGLSVVAVDERGPDAMPDDVDFVTVDHTRSIEIAVDHLIAHGHSKIAYIADCDTTTFSRRSKAEGFKTAMVNRSLSDVRLITPKSSISGLNFGGTELADLGRQGVDQIFDRYPDTTAIVTFNDMTAIGALEALRSRGIDVPGDVSIVGIDGISFGEIVSPKLTSVREPLELTANAAVSCLWERIVGGRKQRRDVIIAPELLERGSVATQRRG